MKEKYSLLSTYICRNDNKKVLDILAKNKALDVRHENGSYFIIALDNNNVSIIKALLQHFEDNQLQPYQEYYKKFKETNLEQYRDHYQKYLILQNTIRAILEIAAEDVDLSEEIKKVLSKYIDFGDSECEKDVSDYELHDDILTDEEYTSHISTSSESSSYNSRIEDTDYSFSIPHDKITADDSYTPNSKDILISGGHSELTIDNPASSSPFLLGESDSHTPIE